MARIRTIKPDFWTDEKVVELSFEARLFFIGSWNFSDDNGNLQRSAKKLKMQIFPADAIDCEPIIQSLITHGLLSEYSVNGETFLHIKGFNEHQVINRRSKSGLPMPDSVSNHAPLTECSLTEGKGREGKKEQKKEQPPGKPVAVAKVDLPSWVDAEAWVGFASMRRKERHPLTDRATRLIVTKLEGLRADGNDPSAVLDQSTRNGWRDVFPVKSSKSALPNDGLRTHTASETLDELMARAV